MLRLHPQQALQAHQPLPLMHTKHAVPTHLEIKRIQLCSEKHRQQQHYSEVVQERRRPRPLERREVVWRELAQHALGLGANSARLAEAAPFVWLRDGIVSARQTSEGRGGSGEESAL